MPMYGRTFGRVAVEAARRAGAFASGRSYIQKYFPPGYREPAIKLITAFEQAATGAGLYQIYQSFIDDDGTGNVDAPFSQPSSGKFKKTYNRYPRRSRGRYSGKQRFGPNRRCSCPRKRSRSRYSKYEL